jgi:hypothetical protein
MDKVVLVIQLIESILENDCNTIATQYLSMKPSNQSYVMTVERTIEHILFQPFQLAIDNISIYPFGFSETQYAIQRSSLSKQTADILSKLYNSNYFKAKTFFGLTNIRYSFFIHDDILNKCNLRVTLSLYIFFILLREDIASGMTVDRGSTLIYVIWNNILTRKYHSQVVFRKPTSTIDNNNTANLPSTSVIKKHHSKFSFPY